MKKLLILFSLFLLVNCAGFNATETEPLDIHASEIMDGDIVGELLLNPYILQCLIETERGVVIAQLWIPNGLLMKYAYIDNGDIVGFVFDSALYATEGALVYKIDVIPQEGKDYIRGVFERYANGVSDPLDVPVTEKEGV